MLDFHTHILPGVDDGSRSIEESIVMLQELKEQGCEIIAATPHFMADSDTPENFFNRRQSAYEAIVENLTDSEQDFPHILLGAEVLYYPGISRMKGLSSFCLQNSRLLLLEMPISHWNESVIRELIEMTCSGEIRLVLAHFERYFDMQSKDVWRRLADNGVMLQTNASFLVNPRTRRKALKMLQREQIHFLGSDCHDTRYRPPRIGSAVSIIHNKLGPEFIKEWEKFQKLFFH